MRGVVLLTMKRQDEIDREYLEDSRKVKTIRNIFIFYADTKIAASIFSKSAHFIQSANKNTSQHNKNTSQHVRYDTRFVKHMLIAEIFA